MKLNKTIAAMAVFSVALASCSDDDGSSNDRINPSYSVFVNGVKIISADSQNLDPENKEIEVTQYDNVSFCSNSVNVVSTKWLVSSENNNIEAEDDSLHLQFPNVVDVYNNVDLCLMGMNDSRMDISVPVTFNVKFVDIDEPGEGLPEPEDNTFDILDDGVDTRMSVSDDNPNVIRIEIPSGTADFKLKEYSVQGFEVKVEDAVVELVGVARALDNGMLLELTLKDAVPAGGKISVSYDGAGDVIFINGRKMAAFDTAGHPDMEIENNVTPFTSEKLDFVIENDASDMLVISFKDESSAMMFADGVSADGISIKVGDVTASISSLTLSDDKKTLIIKLAENMKYADVVSISYQPGNIALSNGNKLQNFSDVNVTNNIKPLPLEITRQMISFYKNGTFTAISIKPGLTDDKFVTPTNLINSFTVSANGSRVNIRSVSINNNINITLPVAVTKTDNMKLAFDGNGLVTENGYTVQEFAYDDLKLDIVSNTNTGVFDSVMHGFERYVDGLYDGDFDFANFATLGWSVSQNVGGTNNPVKYETLADGANKNVVLVIDNTGNISSVGQIYFMPKTYGGQQVSFPKAGTYTLKFWYKTDGLADGTEVKRTFQYKDASNTKFKTACDVKLQNFGWTEYTSGQFVFDEVLTTYKFNFSKGGIPDGTKIYIDDIQLIPVI